MLLTYGNIRKSKILRYYFFDDLDNETFAKYVNIYYESINTKENNDYLKIDKYLHDAEVKIEIQEKDIIIHLIYWDKKSEHKKAQMIFTDAKIISQNKIKKSGHIARLNKRYIPVEYGYDELYTDKGSKYITIIFFYRRWEGRKINTGIYYPLMTIKYDKIKTIFEEDSD
jgi:hypothetical protein